MDERKKKIIMYILTLSEESSSDSSDEEANLPIALALTPEKRRKKPRVENYILTVNLYSDSDLYFGMGKPQSKEEVIIAQNGAANQATTSQFHVMTHEKLNILTSIIVLALSIAFCYVIWRFCARKYTEHLRREIQGARASQRTREPPRAAPAYSVA